MPIVWLPLMRAGRACARAYARGLADQDPKKRHELDRRAVSELVCALCGERQPSGAVCRSCSVAFGAYTCLKCSFFDDELEKQQFHCEECGICRVGGRENFFHCKTCSACYSTSLKVAAWQPMLTRLVNPGPMQSAASRQILRSSAAGFAQQTAVACRDLENVACCGRFHLVLAFFCGFLFWK
jgi:CHY zinc finger